MIRVVATKLFVAKAIETSRRREVLLGLAVNEDIEAKLIREAGFSGRVDFYTATVSGCVGGQGMSTSVAANRRKRFVRSARVHIRQIVDEFGGMPLSAVRPSQVKAWVARLRVDGLTQSYVYSLYRRLSQIMDDAVHDGVLGRNPCSRRTAPPMGKAKVYVATTEQMWAIHDAVPDHLRVAVLLGAFAGLRVAEAAGLGVSDVDFTRGVQPRQQWPEGFTFHDLRHYLASLLIPSGADIKTIQARMRHASARTTLDTYGHLWPDADESTRTAIAERMDSVGSTAYRLRTEEGSSRRRRRSED